MNTAPAKITLAEWEVHFERCGAIRSSAPYMGPLSRHVRDGDARLPKLRYDNSLAALRLWNFVLSEEDRLLEARLAGKIIVGTMKDLGTVPVIAYATPNLVAFYPDGAWWTPCIMEDSTGLLPVADALGLGETFCPVRAMAGAFVTRAHFPIPDALVCSVGATCDDFSAIAQRLEGLGYPIVWWEIPHRRRPSRGEAAVQLATGCEAPVALVRHVAAELQRIREILQELSGFPINDESLARSIRKANRIRTLLRNVRQRAFTAEPCPLPALEVLLAEMLAIHFCSDQAETEAVLSDLLRTTQARVARRQGVLPEGAVRVFWVNPVADLRVMNVLEECGGRLCGTDFLFGHAIQPIPEDIPPMEALACMALADPMVGTSEDRALGVCSEAARLGAEAVIISRIPGASHCAYEGRTIKAIVQERLDVPVVELEVPPLCDALMPALRTRIEAVVETVRETRKSCL